MSEPQPRWSDAVRIAECLGRRPTDRRLLDLLTHLPLVPEKVLEQMEGLRGGASIYRRLTHLADEGLITAIHPALRSGRNPRLWYLTDLGLTVVALQLRTDPRDLALRKHLRRADLLARLPGLPQLLAAYEILGALAASRQCRPRLVAWERPWRRWIWTASAKLPRSLRFPAFAEIAWEDQAGQFILIPDLAAVPSGYYQPVIRGLFALRAQQGAIPNVLIATSQNGRKNAWSESFERIREERTESSLPVYIVTWTELRRGTVTRTPFVLRQGNSDCPVGTVPCRLQRTGPFRPLPRAVGQRLDLSTGDQPGDTRITALHLGPLGYSLLDFVGRHPFLSTDQLSVALDSPAPRIRKSIDFAVASGFVSTTYLEEAEQDGHKLHLLELTVDGLELVAAQQGLSLAEAVRFNGLAGGGSGHPIGSRQKLITQLAHTRGVDDIFIQLIAQTRKRKDVKSEDALLEWRNAAACASGRVRPDGYGLYQCDGRLYGFFLEYDRGTTSARGYRAKFAAYTEYVVAGKLRSDYAGFPTILVIAANNAVEEQIIRVVREVAIGRVAMLPLLITAEWRLNDHLNPEGLLGSIWRQPGRTFQERRYWHSNQDAQSCGVPEGPT